jgi:hypothetical protein
MTYTHRSGTRFVTAALMVAAICFSTASAEADPNSPYCRAIRARAAGDASLLMTPKALAQGFRIPGADESVSEVGGPTPVGGGTAGSYEARVGGEWSPSDFYKGIETISLGGLDCGQHEIEAAVDHLLAQAQDTGRLPALRKQATFLDAHRIEWQEIARKEQERFTARVISVVDLNTVLLHIVALERQLAQARGEAERLDARAYTRPPATFGAIEASLLYNENAYERTFSRIRTLSAFNVLVVGGGEFTTSTTNPTAMTTTPGTTGWFGVVEATFNLGWFLENAKENTYLDARAEELKNARYERAWRLRSFQKELEAARKEAQAELDIVERQLTAIGSTRRTLEAAETPNVLHAIASLKVDEIAAGSDQAYLRTLIDELNVYLAPDQAPAR